MKTTPIMRLHRVGPTIRRSPLVIPVARHSCEVMGMRRVRFVRLILVGANKFEIPVSRAPMAKWRMVGGLLIVAFVLLALFVLINSDRFPLPANESSAVGSLRTLYAANAEYMKDHPEEDYPKMLNELSQRLDKSEQQDVPKWVIDPALAAGTRFGYAFAY
jgi:hypothetical protein